MTHEWIPYICLAVVAWAIGYAYGDSHGWQSGYKAGLMITQQMVRRSNGSE